MDKFWEVMQECFPMLFNIMMERRKYITVFLPNKLLQKITDFALFIITESIKKGETSKMSCGFGNWIQCYWHKLRLIVLAQWQKIQCWRCICMGTFARASMIFEGCSQSLHFYFYFYFYALFINKLDLVEERYGKLR